MKKILFCAFLLSLAGAASATYCDANTLHPGAGAPIWPDHCNDAPTPPTTPTGGTMTGTVTGTMTGTVTGDQKQKQGQQQAANSTADSTSKAKSASTANGNGVGAGANAGSGNSNGQVANMYAGGAPGSGDSYRETTIVAPSVPMTPPSVVAGAVLTTTVSACGPLQRIVAESVYGDYRGMFSHDSVYLGQTQSTDIFLDENGQPKMYQQIDGRLYGMQVIYTSGALGVASGSNVSIGGWSSSGAGGNGGGGVSGAMQRLVTTVQLRYCDVTPAPQPIVFQPYIAPPPVAPRRPVVKRRPAPVTCNTVVKQCKAS